MSPVSQNFERTDSEKRMLQDEDNFGNCPHLLQVPSNRNPRSPGTVLKYTRIVGSARNFQTWTEHPEYSTLSYWFPETVPLSLFLESLLTLE